MNKDWVQVQKESDERVRKLLNKVCKQEIADFDARTNKSVEVMPYEDESMIFRQQGRRVSWGRAGARYVSARHYPNDECAKQIIDELVRRGAKNVSKENEERTNAQQIVLL